MKVLIRMTVQQLRDAGAEWMRVPNQKATECKSCGVRFLRFTGWKWRISAAVRFCLCADCSTAVRS